MTENTEISNESKSGGRMEASVRLLGTVSLWLLALIFFTLPMTAIRVQEVAIADLLIILLIPLAFLLFVTTILLRKRFGQLPKWLWISGAFLLVSIALVQLFPASAEQLDRVADSFDAYGLESGSSLVVGIRVIFALIALPIMISVVVDRFSRVDLLVSVWIAGVSISCVVAILDAAFDLGLQKAFSYDPDSISGYLVVFPGDTPRMVGLADHPNTLSLTGVMVSPLVMARMKTRQGLLWYSPVLLIIFIGVLTSGARIGVVGLALAVVLTVAMDKRVWPAFRRLSKKTVAVIASVAILLTVLVFVGAYSPADSTAGKLVPSSIARLLRPSEDTRAISDRERESRIDDSLEYISERPVIGYGYNWVESSHNSILQMLLAGGLAGLIGYFIAVGGFLQLGFRQFVKVPDQWRNVSLALFISFVLFVVSGVVSNFIFGRFLYMPAGLILAVYMFELARTQDSVDPGGNPSESKAE